MANPVWQASPPSTGDTGTSSNLVVPAGWTVGALAYLVVEQTGGQAITVTSTNGAAGWTTAADLQVLNSSTNRLTVYETVLTAADIGSTVTVTFGASQIHAIAIVALAGHNGRNATGNPGVNKSTASTTNTFSGVTPDMPDCAVIYFNGSNRGSSSASETTSSTPTGYTEEIDQCQAGTNNHAGLSIGYKMLTGGSGTTETPANITLSQSARGLTLVLAVAPTPPTPLWTNRFAGTAARNGTTGHTLDWSSSFTATASRKLYLIIEGGTTTSTPAGWTLEKSAVANTGLYVFSKTAAGGETSLAVTHGNSNYAVHWAIFEFPVGSTTAGTAGSLTGQNVTTWAAVTSLPGTAVTVFAVASIFYSTTHVGPGSVIFTSPWIENVDQFLVGGATDGAYLAVGYQDGVTAASSTPAGTLSLGTSGGPNGERVTFAVSVSTSTPIAASDTGTLSEGASSITATPSVVDTGTLTESPASAPATVNATDQAALSEAIGSIALARTDSATLAEAVAGIALDARTDTGTLSEASSPAGAPAASDTGTLSEASSVTQIGTNPTASDAATLSEGVTVITVVVGVTDALALLEVASVAAAVTASDAATLTDASALAVPAAAVDTLSFVEASAVVAPFVPPVGPFAFQALDDLISDWFKARVGTGPSTADRMLTYFAARSGLSGRASLTDHMAAYYAGGLGVIDADTPLTDLEIAFWEAVDPTNNVGSWGQRARKFYGGT